jgi:hypothetical protein
MLSLFRLLVATNAYFFQRIHQHAFIFRALLGAAFEALINTVS